MAKRACRAEAYGEGGYTFEKSLRALVTVNVPSCCADSLTQYARPLWSGGGGAFGPAGGSGAGATGNALG